MTKPDEDYKYPCGHVVTIPHGLIKENIKVDCPTCEVEGYVYVSGSKGEDGPHWHSIGNTGSTRHNHSHTGRHVHEREARISREGGTHIQTGYKEGA